LPHHKIRREFLKRGTAVSGALKANALPGGARRLAVRAVKGAQFAFIGPKRETLEEKRAVQAQVFSRKGWERKTRFRGTTSESATMRSCVTGTD